MRRLGSCQLDASACVIFMGATDALPSQQKRYRKSDVTNTGAEMRIARTEALHARMSTLLERNLTET